MSEIIITPLGTVSPYAKGNMNCPGFLVRYNDKNILLDCGNGITRLFSFPEDLKDLNVIITHYHKDHFGDLGALQYASYIYHNLRLLDEKIKIYLPLNDFAFNKASIISNNESYSEYYDINDSYLFFVDDLKITFEDNNSHNIKSYMVKLQNEDLKIIYTSDIGTTNFDKLVDFCTDADLIICESSYLQKHKANSKTHMTAYVAGVLASKANAKRLLLTHFWPEEDKKLYLEEALQSFYNVETAVENKKIILRK